jgi:hypothetical protein
VLQTSSVSELIGDERTCVIVAFSSTEILQESLMLLCSRRAATIISDFVGKAEGGAETMIAA